MRDILRWALGWKSGGTAEAAVDAYLNYVTVTKPTHFVTTTEPCHYVTRTKPGHYVAEEN